VGSSTLHGEVKPVPIGVGGDPAERTVHAVDQVVEILGGDKEDALTADDRAELVGEHVADELGRGHIGAKHPAITDVTFSVPILERAVAPCAVGGPDRGKLQDHRGIAGLDPDLLTEDPGDSSAIGPASVW
jgi:hypothetical protein